MALIKIIHRLELVKTPLTATNNEGEKKRSSAPFTPLLRNNKECKQRNKNKKHDEATYLPNQPANHIQSLPVEVKYEVRKRRKRDV